jgi:hypothetical protein
MSQDTKAGFTTEIPMNFRRRDGKAVIVLPDGSRAIERRETLIDNAMVKLLGRGQRWHRKLFDGTHASIEDMAKSENISPSFVSRILRLAYLSPTIVEAILDGMYPAHLTMKDLMEPFPVEWESQEQIFLSSLPSQALNALNNEISFGLVQSLFSRNP